MNKQQEPRLRFQGFTGEWECRKLGEIAFKVKEKNIAYQYAETFTNSAEFGIISQQDFFDKSISNSENIGGYYVVQPDDFVYNPRISSFAPVGPIKRNKLGRTGVMSPLYYVFRLNDEIKPSYLEQYFEGNQWHHFMYLNGDTGARSDRFSIKNDVFAEMPISFPANKNEQTHFGNFFRRLDSQIAESRAVLEKSRQLKKAMLAKMFPANGEKIPKIRFKGFEGEWECRKLGDLMNVTSVKRIHQSDWTNEGVRFLRARDIVAFNKGEKIEEPLFISKEKYNEYSEISGKVKIGDLLVTGVGTIGVPYLIEDENLLYFKDGNVIWFQNENKIGGLFFYYSFLNNFIQDFIIETAGIGTVGTYTIDTGKKTPIFLPPTESEQTAIGNFFRQLDENIALQSAEVEKLNQLKKGLLAAMLV